MRDVAFLLDPSTVVVSIGAFNYNEPGTDLIAEQPTKFFEAQDEDDVWDFCMKVADAAPLPSGYFVIDSVSTLVTAVEFVGGRPPVRPPAL